MSSRMLVECIAAAVLVYVGLSASTCRADYTEELGVSLEWMTDSSKAVAVVESQENGEFNWGWPMRVVCILKPHPSLHVGQIYRVDKNLNRPEAPDRYMIFLHEDDDGKLIVHDTCGRDIHEYYPGSPEIRLLGFDREGRFVQSLDQAIDIVTRRVLRGPNLPEPDYSKASRYKEPFEGGFYRMAENDFDDFYYMVLVPADPDFKQILELRSGLPIGYIMPGTLEANYTGERGPISNHPLDEATGVAALTDVLREMGPQISRQGLILHSRWAVGDVLSYQSSPNQRAIIASPDGKLLLAGEPGMSIYTNLLDASTGETLFSGEIYRFSPHGTFLLTRHSDSEYGIRRADDRELVCELESSAPGLYIDSTTLQFTSDERTIFCSRFENETSTLSVYDLESGERISNVVVDSPFFRISDVYPRSAYLLTHRMNIPGYCLFNWRTGEYVHQLSSECRLPEVGPNDKVIAYMRTEPSDDEITPDAFTLVIEDLASRQELRAIRLPSEPKDIRFIAGGQTVMTIFELTAWNHTRKVALLYGVEPSEVDGETISWTPAGR